MKVVSLIISLRQGKISCKSVTIFSVWIQVALGQHLQYSSHDLVMHTYYTPKLSLKS
jgi:hypothetical protein